VKVKVKKVGKWIKSRKGELYKEETQFLLNSKTYSLFWANYE
jgi:hypothetical protein